MPQCSDERLNPRSDVEFCEAINLRGDICKLSASIGSCKFSNEPWCVFDFDKPLFAKWEESYSTLKSVVNPEDLSYVHKHNQQNFHLAASCLKAYAY